MRLTVTECCRIATVTVMGDKIARLTDVRAKNARLCGYRTLYNGPTIKREKDIMTFVKFRGKWVSVFPRNFGGSANFEISLRPEQIIPENLKFLTQKVQNFPGGGIT